jgi:hypothetical protein
MAKGKPERFIFASDGHGHKADPHACGVLFNFMKAWKPTCRIMGGDAFDFAALRKGASDEEKREPLHDDIASGIDFIDKFKPTHYLLGNHEVRLIDLMDSDDGKLADYGCGVWNRITDAIGDAKVFPYDKRRGVFQYGDTAMIHGYGHGMYAARAAAAVYGKCIMGHTHTIDAASVPRLQETIGRCAGALCQLDQRYNRAHLATLRARHGFCYGFKLPSGVCVIYQAESHDGTWFLPSEMSQISSR